MWCECTECRTINFDEVVIDALLGSVKLMSNRRRAFKWMKKARPSTIDMTGDSLSGDLGLEMMSGHATFDDGGKHVVLEIVDGLEWAVIDAESGSLAAKVRLDFDEAVAQCKLLNQSEKEVWDTTTKTSEPKTRRGFFRR